MKPDPWGHTPTPPRQSPTLKLTKRPAQAYLSRALQHLDEFCDAHPEVPAAAVAARLKALHGIDLQVGRP